MILLQRDGRAAKAGKLTHRGAERGTDMMLNPGPTGVAIGVLMIALAMLALRARVHVEPAGSGWPRVRERDGVRASMVALLALAALLGAIRATGMDYWLIGEGRVIARGGDWYQERSLLQYLLLGVLVLLYAAALLNVRHIHLGGPNARLGIGLAALVALIHVEALRLLSLHAIDGVMYLRLGPVTLVALVEGLIVLAGIAALLARRRQR